jgi:dihydroxyacetone kinase
MNCETESLIGIHNEPGHRRGSPIPPLDKLVEEVIKMLTTTTDPERSFLDFKHDEKDHVVLMVNNLGGTSELEMGAIAAASVLELRRRGFHIDRALIGTFMVCLYFLDDNALIFR